MRKDYKKFLMITVPISITLLGIFIFILVWSTISTGGQHGQPGLNEFFSESNLRINPHTQFTVTTLSGETFSSESIHGEYLMIDFWASWCPPCIKEAPVLSKSYEKWGKRGIKFIGVALWDTEENILSFQNRFAINYPLALDTEGQTAINFGVRALPEKFFIDKNGKILKKIIGPVSEDQLNKILDELDSLK